MPDCTCHFTGRLGNHMFILAAAYAHAKRNGHRLVINKAAGNAKYWNGILVGFQRYFGDSTEKWRLWREPTFSYTPIPAHVTFLYGFFQSSKYFSEYRDEIRALFIPPQSICDEVHAKWGSLKKDSIVVHIRRGDYADPAQAHHGILNKNYFLRAMGLAPHSTFLIFSDEIEWCKQQDWLQRPDCIFVDEPDETKALYLMSLFQSFIVSNSTFSWWAAYLASSRNVWAPDQWFHHSYHIKEYHDIYEPSWIRVPIV